MQPIIVAVSLSPATPLLLLGHYELTSSLGRVGLALTAYLGMFLARSERPFRLPLSLALFSYESLPHCRPLLWRNLHIYYAC